MGLCRVRSWMKSSIYSLGSPVSDDPKRIATLHREGVVENRVGSSGLHRVRIAGVFCDPGSGVLRQGNCSLLLVSARSDNHGQARALTTNRLLNGEPGCDISDISRGSGHQSRL